MVQRDTARCQHEFRFLFRDVEHRLVRALNNAKLPTTNEGVNYRPVTFLRGWSRGGEAVLSLPNVSGSSHLVMVEITSGHYEVTLGVLVNDWPRPRHLSRV